MKKTFILIFILSLLTACTGLQTKAPPSLEELQQQAQGAGANKVRAFTCLIGGTTGCVDKISVDDWLDADIAMVGIISGTTVTSYKYIFDDDGTDAEDAVNYTIIRPDDYVDGGVLRLTKITQDQLPSTISSITISGFTATRPVYSDGSGNLVAGDNGGDIEISGDDLEIKSGAVDFVDLSAGAKFTSYQVSDLGDAATPSVLTTAETTNSVFSNYKSSGADHVFTMPAAHAAGNVIFTVGDEFQVDIEPNGGDLFYLNGTAMAADEHIQNTADTLGDRIVGYCVNINGTLRWMFYGDANWVEATP